MQRAKNNHGTLEENEGWKAYTTKYQNYYKALVIKTWWYLHKVGQIELMNMLNNPQTGTHIYSLLYFDKILREVQQESDLFNKWFWSKHT